MQSWSPGAVLELSIAPGASSRMLRVLKLKPRKRHGPTDRHKPSTRLPRSSAMTSIGKPIPQVCTPEEGLMRSPLPGARGVCPSKPKSLLSVVSATRARGQSTVPWVWLVMSRCCFMRPQAASPWPLRRSKLDARFANGPALLSASAPASQRTQPCSWLPS